VRYVYTGNVVDPEGQRTYCHGCHALLIERDRYHLGACRLRDGGCCPDCGTRIPGRF
jgi:pyruvate formate lyase activating enzyme